MTREEILQALPRTLTSDDIRLLNLWGTFSTSAPASSKRFYFPVT